MDAYKDNGPDEAVRAWIKGSALEGSKEALSQANILRQVQDYYGRFQGFETVNSREISPRTRVDYLVIDYDKGPLFAKFISYRTDGGWVLVNFVFNTKEEQILPQCP